MTMSPRVRKAALTAHVVSSIGWLGAIVAFLALAIAGVSSQDPELVRAVYLAAEPLTLYVLVPLAFASLLTGFVQSLGTKWGLLRHYWVVFKLVINLVATTVLLIYTQTVSSLARIAADLSVDVEELRGPTFILHSGAALILLLAATVLGVFKPAGMTRYGRRKRRQLGTNSQQ
jgi:hypothetical protein